MAVFVHSPSAAMTKRMAAPRFLTTLNWILLIVYAISFGIRHVPLTNTIELLELANTLPWIAMLLAIGESARAWRMWFARISNILFLILLTGIFGLMATRNLDVIIGLLFLVGGIVPCAINLFVLFTKIRRQVPTAAS